MSFILDALRKSEHERQRQTGPALVESAVAPPRPRNNIWPTVAIALLLVNIVAIGVVLLMKSGGEPEAASAPATASTSTPPAPSSMPTAATAAAAATAAQASVTQTLPEPQLAAPPPPAAANAPLRSARNPLEDEVANSEPAPVAEAGRTVNPPPGPAAVRATRPGTVIYQTLPEADVATNYAPAPAPAPAAANLPTADEITARGGLPELRLELHVYSNRPQDRFVFLNGRRYREGDTTAEGAAIQEITPDGVVMSAGGNRFLLPRD